MPCERRISVTSSPVAGLLVVLFVTVPVIEAASAKPGRAIIIAAPATVFRKNAIKKVTPEVYRQCCFVAELSATPSPNHATRRQSFDLCDHECRFILQAD